MKAQILEFSDYIPLSTVRRTEIDASDHFTAARARLTRYEDRFRAVRVDDTFVFLDPAGVGRVDDDALVGHERDVVSEPVVRVGVAYARRLEFTNHHTLDAGGRVRHVLSPQPNVWDSRAHTPRQCQRNPHSGDGANAFGAQIPGGQSGGPHERQQLVTHDRDDAAAQQRIRAERKHPDEYKVNTGIIRRRPSAIRNHRHDDADDRNAKDG